METTEVIKMVSSSKPMIGEGGDNLPTEKKEKKNRRILPADMQREILSRTPARSLVRFRVACKIWYELTYDPTFIDLHVEHAHLRKISSRAPHLLAISQRLTHFHVGFSLIMLDETMTPIAKIPCSGMIDERCYGLYFTRSRNARLCPPRSMTPPCNGLVCAYNFCGDALLVNPMTRECLPLRQDSEPVERYYHFQKCYLGFHPATKEYKVVRFLYLGWDCTVELFYEVLTLGIGIWRRRIYHGDENFSTSCEDFLSGYKPSQTEKILGDGISANGVVYILNQINRKIGLFDLKDEKFSTVIPYHDSISVDEDHQSKLVELEGSICLVVRSSIPQEILDVWMLEDAADHFSWIHRHRVALHHQFIGLEITPFLIHQGELLVGYKNCNFYYLSLKSNKESPREVTNEQLQDLRVVHAYEGSLVSLGGKSIHSFSIVF